MASNGRITLAVIKAKQEETQELLKELIGEFKQHVKEDQVLTLDVDRLKQSDYWRQRHIWLIWTTILSSVVAWFFKS